MRINDFFKTEFRPTEKMIQEAEKSIQKKIIYPILIKDYDQEAEAFLADIEQEELESFTALIPLSLYASASEKGIDFGKLSDRIVGSFTYGIITGIEENILLVNRAEAITEKENQFMEKYKEGDELTCRFQNIAFRKNDNNDNYQEIGIYITHEGMRGYLPKHEIPNMEGRNLYELGIISEDEIIGTISRIDRENRIFILSVLGEKEELEIGKHYLGKIRGMTEKSYVFSVKGNTVFLNKKLIQRKFSIGDRMKIRIFSKSEENPFVYFCSL